MNKLILLLSMMLTLAACSSQDAPKDENELPPGIMQPVEGTGAIAGGAGCLKSNNIVCQRI
ncbi:Uncharacterised protein [Aggregatibacter aphrophilus]|uniref:Lipoprotein n=1 Tax=Aggregatibacter aphrophilus TaxID=732 RepID=A0A336NAR4_AGGAP|nr:Uncharacterised protein [Aggregatibacter aphrophilus]